MQNNLNMTNCIITLTCDQTVLFMAQHLYIFFLLFFCATRLLGNIIKLCGFYFCSTLHLVFQWIKVYPKSLPKCLKTSKCNSYEKCYQSHGVELSMCRCGNYLNNICLRVIVEADVFSEVKIYSRYV